MISVAVRDLALSLGLLLVAIAVGWVLGRLGLLLTPTSGDEATETDVRWMFSDGLTFVGGVFGLILGLLLVFGAQDFGAAKESARSEAAAAVALFEAVTPLDTSARDEIRRDVVCYMNSVATDDWAATEARNLTGAQTTDAWSAQLHNSVAQADLATEGGVALMYSAADELMTLDKERQMRLTSSIPEIPPAVWIVIYMCSAAFVAMLVMRLGHHRRAAVIITFITAIVLVTVVGSLTVLDMPFAGPGATIRPVAIQAARTQLQDTAPNDNLWAACPAEPETSAQ